MEAAARGGLPAVRKLAGADAFIKRSRWRRPGRAVRHRLLKPVRDVIEDAAEILRGGAARQRGCGDGRRKDEEGTHDRCFHNGRGKGCRGNGERSDAPNNPPD